jgi:hypothetical protein
MSEWGSPDNLINRLYAVGDGGSNWLAHLIDHAERCESPGHYELNADDSKIHPHRARLNLQIFLAHTSPHRNQRRSFTLMSDDTPQKEDILTEEAVTIIRAVANLYAEGADPYYREKLYKIANMTPHSARNAYVQELVEEAVAKAPRSAKAKALVTEIAKWRLLGTPPSQT